MTKKVWAEAELIDENYTDNSSLIGMGKVRWIVDKNIIHDIPEPVELPAFVAEWIEKYKPMNSLRVAFIYIYELPREDKFKIWIENGMSETFARAWLYGYTVTKEKTYRVKLPDNESKSTTNILALRRTQDGRIVINQVSKTAFIENEKSFLTEDEIKRNHEYLWGFAEEVESE